MLATIEHMQQKAAIAREAKRLLGPGGRVVITVPSLMVDKILSVLLFLHFVDGMLWKSIMVFNQLNFPLFSHRKVSNSQNYKGFSLD